MPVELQPRVRVFQLESWSKCKRIYQALVMAPSQELADESLVSYIRTELLRGQARIDGMQIMGYSFHQIDNYTPPKSVLQWFMDLILGSASDDREWYYSIEVHLDRSSKAKA